MKKALSLVLTLVLIVSLAACAGNTVTNSQSPAADTTGTTPPPAVSPAPAVPAPVKYTVRAGFLKGPTGIGAAWLMEENAKGQTQLDYKFTVESDPAIMMSSIISGSVDIAAVPTNVAATLYKKTNGGVKLIAINTLSVLYILENGDTVKSVADLKGKTIYATGQAANPEYVLNYILRQNGLEPGKDVTVEFADAGEIATKMASGDISLCMLPVPNSTSVLVKNADARVAVDMGMVWGKITAGGSLPQGCVVVRSDLENLDAVVSAFLDDYWKSILYMDNADNLDDAARLAFKYEMVGSEAIAKAAIPDCNIVLITGADNMKNTLSGYFDVLFKADPKSLGGAIPDDAFYYGG
jgi:NitT/TauT family transport system substrate-binding protein